MSRYHIDNIELSLFSARFNAICDEMGAVLRHAAFSPNIKDRLDFSCAIFDQNGELCAQAAHIPVHLGSMAYAMNAIVSDVQWTAGDMMILNDPYLGGTHLPDVTLIAPVFDQNQLLGFVANRAHHADIGCDSPGSMPLSSDLAEEGVLISPQLLLRDGEVDTQVFESLLTALMNPDESRGDFTAQISANKKGVERVVELSQQMGLATFREAMVDLNHYAASLAQSTLALIPNGCYAFSDVMDDDGMGRTRLPIKVTITKTDAEIEVNFNGTAAQTPGNINCPMSVTAAAVFYVFRCLMPANTPAAAGSFEPIKLVAPAGCLVNAKRPAAVAAGNVETSTRIVDVVLGALAQALPERIPAASHGSMNNLAMGYHAAAKHAAMPSWAYYETIGGGMGASAQSDGLHAVQTHMTNTYNTPVEVLESLYPLRIKRYQIRKNSGGDGKRRGGNGMIREYEFLAPTQVTLLTERRQVAPWGLAGGHPGKVGQNLLNGKPLPAKVHFEANSGDVLTIKTAGGGGFGDNDS